MGCFKRSNVNSVKYGSETITSLGAKIWKILPHDYKELTSLSTFKSKIKNWETDKYPCGSCTLGFIWLGIVLSDQCLLNFIFAAVVVCLFVVAVVVVAVYYYY